MSITLELTPQEEEWVRNAATQSGQPPSDFVKATILQSLAYIRNSADEKDAAE